MTLQLSPFRGVLWCWAVLRKSCGKRLMLLRTEIMPNVGTCHLRAVVKGFVWIASLRGKGVTSLLVPC